MSNIESAQHQPTSFWSLDRSHAVHAKPSTATSVTSSVRAWGTVTNQFPSVPTVPPTKMEYIRMMMFVILYLICVLVVVTIAWVAKDEVNRDNRLILVGCCILGAIFRVVMGSWILKAAGPRLALVFVEVDMLALSLVGFFALVIPTSFTINSLQTNLSYDKLTPQMVGTIFASAAVKEFIKFFCYIVPFFLGQVGCVSHLLFTGIMAGAMGVLYIDIFTNATIEISWQTFLISVLYTMLYTLWTSMGCAFLCLILRKRVTYWLAPLIIIVPILFHSGYIFAIAGRPFGWIWSGIVVAYWLLSAIVLKLLIAPSLPVESIYKRWCSPDVDLDVLMVDEAADCSRDDIPASMKPVVPDALMESSAGVSKKIKVKKYSRRHSHRSSDIILKMSHSPQIV